MVCKNAIFQAKDENTLTPEMAASIQANIDRLTQNRAVLNERLAQYDMMIEQGRNPASFGQGSREDIQRELFNIGVRLREAQNQMTNSYAQYVTSKENKSMIIRRNNSGKYKGCPAGYFLTGAQVQKKKGFRVKCSQLSVLRD